MAASEPSYGYYTGLLRTEKVKQCIIFPKKKFFWNNFNLLHIDGLTALAKQRFVVKRLCCFLENTSCAHQIKQLSLYNVYFLAVVAVDFTEWSGTTTMSMLSSCVDYMVILR